MFNLLSGMTFLAIPLTIGIGLLFLFFCVIGFIMANQIIKSKKNKQQPILLDNAVAISKRTKISHQRIATTQVFHKVMRCYITFQLESGIQKEFLVTDDVFGVIAENDRGMLKYQGADFISFVRE